MYTIKYKCVRFHTSVATNAKGGLVGRKLRKRRAYSLSGRPMTAGRACPAPAKNNRDSARADTPKVPMVEGA